MRSVLVALAVLVVVACGGTRRQTDDGGTDSGAPPIDAGSRTCAEGCEALMRCVDGLCTPYPPCTGDGRCVDGYVCRRRLCLPADRDLDGDGAIASVDCDEGEPAVHPSAREDCNQRDDDCDGVSDEDIAERACSSACGGGSERCESGAWSGCTAIAPRDETCDGTDEDCDSRVDEGLVRGCSSACGSGAERCVDGAFAGCTAPPPYDETCDGADQDCDGVPDDGLRTAVRQVAFTELRARHEGCDPAVSRYGAACNSAIHRWCGRDCHRSGFGPVEQGPDTASITCTSGELRSVSFAALMAVQTPCNASEPAGLYCSSGIHRWCRSQGFESGYGPLEVSTTEMQVSCVPANLGTMIGTTYTTLASYHPGCNASPEYWGPACASATHRFCSAAGYASGFGPVEASGNDAVVVCVRP